MNDWHVVKVGGSLFDLPDLPQRLRRWLAQQPLDRIVLLAGGGELTDVIRRADQRFNLGEEASHWLCIDALRVSARWLSRLLPELPLVATWAELTQCLAPGPNVFDATEFFSEVEPSLPSVPLPHTWQVTTDSLAARLAITLAAPRLTLLKSQSPPNLDWPHLAQEGYVDSHFPNLVAAVRQIDCVGLRDCVNRATTR